MNEIVFELYKSVNLNHIENRKDSLYWIYDIENIITKENNISKRYIKVLFFNKRMNENNNLMRLYLSINGKQYEQNQFTVVSQYQNTSIMGFITEIDLIDDKKEVDIYSYILDGIRIDLSEKKFMMPPIQDNTKKLAALKNYYFEDSEEIHVYPQMNENGWLCCCGYYAANEEEICPICAKKKEKIKEILSVSIEDCVLSKLMDKVIVSTDMTIDNLIQSYQQSLKENYDILPERSLGYFDKEILVNRQKNLIQKKVEEYVHKPIEIDCQKSFEENIDHFCNGIINQVITKSDVLNQINIEELKSSYEEKRKSYIHSKRKKKLMMVSIILLVLLCIGGYFIYGMIFKDDYSGVEILNTEEFRKNNCYISAENAVYNNENVEKIAKEKHLCNFEVSDTSIPESKVIKEEDGKEILVLDNEHLLVKEVKKISENEKKVFYNITDLNQKVIVNFEDINYYLEYYENGKLVKSDVYSDGIKVLTYAFEYKDNQNYTIKEFEAESQTNTLLNEYHYENDILRDFISYDIWSSTGEYGTNATVTYDESGDMSQAVYYSSNTGELNTRITYENNKIKEISSYSNGNLMSQDKWIYDKNGILLQIKNTYYFDQRNDTQVYNFDYEEGKVYYVDFNDATNEIININIKSIIFLPDYVTLNGELYPYLVNAAYINNTSEN